MSVPLTKNINFCLVLGCISFLVSGRAKISKNIIAIWEVALFASNPFRTDRFEKFLSKYSLGIQIRNMKMDFNFYCTWLG